MSKDALYQSLKQRINDGEWPAGQRMPSIRKLALEATFTYHVIVSAYMRLVSEGILSASPGRGYFVASRIGKNANSPETECMAGDSLFRLLQGGPQYTKLGCGWLPPAWRDTQMLAKAIRRTARLEQSSLAEYGDISGYLPMRKQLCVHIKRMTRVDLQPNQILTTLGATQGLDLVTRLLIKPDSVDPISRRDRYRHPTYTRWAGY